MTLAQALLKRFGVEIARSHTERPADGCKLYKCEHGHEDCAHIHRGACLQELTKLIGESA